MKSFSAPSALVALFSGLLLAPTGALAGKVAHRDNDYRSVSEEILGANLQQEQLANLQLQAEISNNVSSLEALNAHTSEIVQRWCDATASSEKERQQRLLKLIDSNVPDLERVAARETRASEVSYDRLAISACKLQKQEIHHGLKQDLAAIQLKTEGSAKTAATEVKATASSAKKADKEFQAYMDSVESGGDSETDSNKHEAKHEQDAKEDATTDEGDESDQEEEQDDAPAKKPAAVAAAVSAKKPQDSHEKKAQPMAKATTKGEKKKRSFLQLAHMQMLSQMSLTQMLELFTSYTDPKQAKRWCNYFESKGKSKTWAKPLEVAHANLDVAKEKFEKLKVLQLGQKKESKLRARFAKFWQADAKTLESLLQQVDNSSQVWAANTHALHAASDRKAIQTAQARFKKIAMFFELALGERKKNIKEQEQKVSVLQSALANAVQNYQDHEAAVENAKDKLKKVEAQIAHILDVCNDIKREGGKLLIKGALSRF